MQPNGCIISPWVVDLDEVFKGPGRSGRAGVARSAARASGQTLGQLCEGLDMTRQAVTKHLRLLEAANLVATM